MPPRKAHHKSRAGCLTCKHRRVKCDEAHPQCRNCMRLGLICSFEKLVPWSRRSAGGFWSTDSGAFSYYHMFSQSNRPPTPSLHPPDMVDTLVQRDRHRNLPPNILNPRSKFLLHHYLNTACTTMSMDGLAHKAWFSAIPKLSSRYPFVLRGAFSFAALHLSRSVGVEKEQQIYAAIAATQMNTGIVHYSKEIRNVTESNAHALFAFSALIHGYTVAITSDECEAKLQSINHEHSPQNLTVSIKELASNVTRLLRTLRGILVIIIPYWDVITHGPLGPLCIRNWPDAVPRTPQAQDEDRKLKSLEKLWGHPGRPYEYWFDALIRTLSSLREAFALVSNLTVDGKLSDFSAILQFLIHISVPFVELLEQQNTEAWVIMAHYSIIAKRAPGPFWTQGLATNVISTAALVLGREKWRWIVWPATAVGVDLKTITPLCDHIDPSIQEQQR